MQLREYLVEKTLDFGDGHDGGFDGHRGSRFGAARIGQGEDFVCPGGTE
jgi:hypothetical protein